LSGSQPRQERRAVTSVQSDTELSPVPFGDPAQDARTASSRRRHLRAVPDLPLDFDAVVRRLRPRLQRYATRRLGDSHEAEELVQEALLRAYQHRSELSTEDDVAAWTTCVTGRLVIDRLRVRGRSTPVADVPEGSRTARDTADVVVARDQARLALDALDSMPPRQAAVLWAREVEGLGYDEIGRRFAMTEPAVRSLLTRARKSLRKEYAVRGGTLPAAGLALLAPWVTGTAWLDRLRTALGKASAPAVLAVAAGGVITGALVLPAGPAPAQSDGPAVVRPHTPAAASTSAVPLPGAGRAAEEPAPPAQAPPAAAIEAPAPPAAPGPNAATQVLTGSGVDDTCVGSSAAGAGGTGCAPPSRPSTWSIGHDDPAGVLPDQLADQLPHLQTTWITCDQVAVPLTQCTPPREDS
jgi:RNA polymerase sigma factor (sigma-70 family)